MAAPDPKPRLTDRLKGHLAEYGAFALWVYFGLFFVVLVGFAVAIQFGAHVESAAGVAGTWGAAYLATKLTQPLRIVATLALTPLLVRLLRKKGPSSDEPAAPNEPRA